MTSPLADDLYTLGVETNVRPRPHDQPSPFGLVYRPTKPIPETLALTIGDAAHNLRAALDHLCTGIVRTVRTEAKEHFPIHPSRQNFVAAPVLNLIEEALPGAKNLVLDEIRPENGANEALWRFNDLDNDDKHNLLIPNVAFVSVHIPLMVGRNVMRNATIGGDAAKPQFLIGTAGPISIQCDLKPAVEISFGPATAFENEPVIPTLTQVAQIVSETIDAFERLIRA